MMADRSRNRTMFWRIIRRLLGANRSRLFVILLALGAGAAITAALLNLQVDAKRRLTTEFRAFGPNVIVAPRDIAPNEPSTMSDIVLQQIPPQVHRQNVTAVGYLYFLAGVSTVAVPKDPAKAVVAGNSDASCTAGIRIAQRLDAKVESELWMFNDPEKRSCFLTAITSTGGPEDDQVTIPLDVAQRLAKLPGRISLIQISVPGTPAEIQQYISDLQSKLPQLEVRPIRQFTEAEGKIYNRISGLLTATVALILVLTAFCVMAAMTNVAMERKNDVGLMKAIGGATRRVLRLFLAEAAVLGLVGGATGAAVGIALSIWLGQAVFGVAARPRLIVYPVAVGLTMLVAIAGAYPLRRLATIRPASVFRGEA
jgi:putative ABC transport system permease protein